MKKVLALVVILVLLGSTAMAEIPDISSLTDDELLKMQLVLSQEIANREIEKTAILKQGSYIGGKDVPTGKYFLESCDEEDAYGIISLLPYDHEEDRCDFELYDNAEMRRNSSYYISLDEGDVLKIPYQFKLTITTGIKFE